MSDALVIAFGLALLLSVLTSALASRSPLSASGVFLVVGLLAGPLALGDVAVSAEHAEIVAEIALFAILFTDGQHASWREVRHRLGTPARALLLGMPLTFGVIAVAARVLVGLDWEVALVLAAVLMPTDPVFASALVQRNDVPGRVRSALNVESGLNDGLALPAVLVLLGTAGGDPEGWSTAPGTVVTELVIGALVGIAVPLAIALLLRVPGIGAVPMLQPLGPLAVAVLLFGVCSILDANSFVAAFLAGATVATVRPSASESFRSTGELVTEMVKGAGLLAFAAQVDSALLSRVDLAVAALVAVVLVVARPVPLLAVLTGSRLSGRDRVAVAWFGPKGFASLAYAVIVLTSGMPGAEDVFVITVLAVLVSVVAHSSTDVAVAGWLSRPRPEGSSASDVSAIGHGHIDDRA